MPGLKIENLQQFSDSLSEEKRYEMVAISRARELLMMNFAEQFPVLAGQYVTAVQSDIRNDTRTDSNAVMALYGHELRQLSGGFPFESTADMSEYFWLFRDEIARFLVSE